MGNKKKTQIVTEDESAVTASKGNPETLVETFEEELTRGESILKNLEQHSAATQMGSTVQMAIAGFQHMFGTLRGAINVYTNGTDEKPAEAEPVGEGLTENASADPLMADTAAAALGATPPTEFNQKNPEDKTAAGNLANIEYNEAGEAKEAMVSNDGEPFTNTENTEHTGNL